MAAWIRELYRKREEKAARRRADREARALGNEPTGGSTRAQGDGNAMLHGRRAMSDGESPVL